MKESFFMKTKKIIPFVLFLLISLNIYAKKYHTAIGIRVGYAYTYDFSYGLSFSRFVKKESRLAYNIRLNNSFRFNDVNGTGLLTYNLKWKTAKRFTTFISTFFGLGLHGIYVNNSHRNADNQGKYYKAGIDIIFGSELKIPHSRFILGADIKPYYHFLGTNNDFVEGGIYVHYSF